ncbi:MAG: YfhO family protein [Lachnospiraceae bacterium]|nr:YfhO family protein [Lachnospiraceae bacterium]
MNRVRQFPLKHPVLCAFLSTAALSFLAMILLQITPFGEKTLLFEDMKRQYVAFYAHYRNVFHSSENFLYSLRKGLGDGSIGFFAYYLSSPLLLPFAFLPVEAYPAAISLLVLVKLSFCSATCCAFLRHFCPPRPERPAQTAILLLSAVSWSFSVYMIANLSNTMWLDAVILMPILCLTADRLMQGAPMWEHTLLVAGILCVNYYIAYMSLLFEGIAVLLYLNRERLKQLPRYLGSLFLGAGMSAALMLPTFFALSGTSKDSLRLGLHILTPPPTWGQILARLYSRSYDATQIFDGAPSIGAGALILLPVALYFLSRSRKREEKLRMAVLLLLMLISFRSPILNLVWHAGTEPRGYLFRNAFVCTLLLIICFYHSMIDLFEGEIRRRDVVLAALGVGVLTAVVFCGDYSYLNLLKKVWNILLLCAGSFLLWLTASPSRQARSRRLLLIAVVLLQSGDLLYGAIRVNMQTGMFYTSRTDFLTEYRDARQAVQGIPRDGEVFRTESLTPIEQNDAMLIGYSGVTYYGSDVQLVERQFLQKLGYNDNGLYAEYEPGNTRTAEALLGIRYLIDGDRLQEREAVPMVVDLPAEDIPDPGRSDPFTYAEAALSALVGREWKVFLPAETQVKETKTPGGEQRVTYTVTPQKDGELYFYLADTEESQNLILTTADGEETPYGNDFNLSVVDIGDCRAGENVSLSITAYDRELAGRPVFVTEDTGLLGQALRELKERGGKLTQITSSHLSAEVPSGSGSAAILLPYDEAWRITLDGQALRTAPLGDLYMRVFLPEGADSGRLLTLDLTYHPKGLAAGFAISGISIILFLFMVARRVLCYDTARRGEKEWK